MRAVDTNIVVRIVTDDEANQVARASKALSKGRIFLPLTVCLETEWVLRSAYRMSSTAIADGLIMFAGLETIEVEDPEMLAEAIAGLRSGMDFADALHMATAAHCESMLSFDTKLAKAARRLGLMPVLEP